MAVLETYKGTETEHGFSSVEIILLLELADARDTYTYPLPDEEDISDEHYILAAQDLTVRGFLEYGEEEDGSEGLRLTEKALQLFDGMLHPVRVLEAFSIQGDIMPTLVYRGKDSSCTVSRWGSSDGYVGIIRMDCSMIGEWLEGEGFLPEQSFETVREAENVLKYEPQTEERGKQLMDRLVCDPQEPPALWALQENVRSALKSVTVSQESMGKSCVFVFLETETESWVLTDAGQDGVGKGNSASEEEEKRTWSILPDSVEYRKEIWRKLL